MRWLPERRTDPHTLAGAYALDALGLPDRSRFERHLGGCPSCRQETEGLREATAMLAAAAFSPPPDGLRDRVLAAAARTRQSPPARPAPVTWPAPARWPLRRWPLRRWPLRRWPLRRWGLAAAGAAAAAALALGGLAYQGQRQLSQEQARTRAVAAVLNAPDAVMMTARATPQGSATMVMSHHMGELVFTAARLPALPSARGYELWLMGGGRVTPAGMLPSPQAGVTAPVVVPGLRAGDTIVVTVEPAAGAAAPSPPMVVRFTLPS